MTFRSAHRSTRRSATAHARPLFSDARPMHLRQGSLVSSCWTSPLAITVLLLCLAGCRNTGNTNPEPAEPEPTTQPGPAQPGTPNPESPAPEPAPTPEPNPAPSPTPEPGANPDDPDGDTVLTVDDNCPDIFNPLQTDFDEDGIGNECDPDTDNDGTENAEDCSPFNASIHPGATEIVGNIDDEDCDGTAQSWVDAATDCSALDCAGTGVDSLLCAMEICYPEYLLNAFVTSPTGDDISEASLALDHYGDLDNDLVPFQGSYAYLGTGRPNSSHQDDLPGVGSAVDPFNANSDPIYDVVELTLRMTAPPGVGGFAIDYIFFSAEYEEWIGTEYNDKFYIVLNAPETTGGVDKIINFTACSNPAAYSDFTDPDLGPQCYIAINTAFSEACSGPVETNIDGTNFECNEEGSSSGWLTTTWPIAPGESFELTFHVHDTSDEVFDSAVVLDHFRWVGTGAKAGTE